MIIHVNSQKTVREIDNFWSHIHFHPTDAIEDNWGQEILDQVSRDKAARTVRIYAMLEDIVTRDEKGKLCFDFTLNDIRIDYMLSQGFQLLICYNFMPRCLAKNPAQLSKLERYKGKRVNYSEPNDYAEWQEVVYQYTQHLVDRYGEATVSRWYLHCWNEPDILYWLNDKVEYDPEKIVSYIKLYDHFAQGILRATGKARFGGPSAAFHMPFFEAFLEHTRSGINQATGEQGSRLDFVSIHTYANNPAKIAAGEHPEVRRNLDRIIAYHEVMKKYGYGDKEILIDEWGASSGGFIGSDRFPEMAFRDTAYLPAFYARMVDVYLAELAKRGINVSRTMICLSGQHDLKKDFDGFRSFFTLNRFPKPIYNGYVMLSRLGNHLLDVSLEAPDPRVGVIPTADENGTCSILVYYMDEDFRKTLPNTKVTLQLSGLEGRYRLKHLRLDQATCNSHAKWAALGKPENPDQMQREIIRKAGRLDLYVPEEIIEGERYEESIVMTQNALSLLVFEKIT